MEKKVQLPPSLQVEEYQDRGAEGELDEGPERGGMEATGENLDGSRV